MVRIVEGKAEKRGVPLVPLIAVAALLHVVVTLLAVNPWHPDEHFQVLEFAWARAGLGPADALPWEWAAGIRSTLQPTLAMVVLEGLRFLGITSPWTWVLVLRLLTLAVVCAVLFLVVVRVARDLTPEGRGMLWLSLLFLWFFPLFFSRFTSENWGGIALVAALPLAQGRSDDPMGDFDVGFLLGLSFVFRFQMGFAIVALLLWIATQTPGGWRRAARVAGYAALVVLASALVDQWFYGEFIITPWRYFQVNVLEGKAATFGTSPFWSYLEWVPLWMAPPLGLVVFGLVVVGLFARPKSPWSWTFIAFVGAHSLIPHKEVRFLLPMLYHFPVLMAYGWEWIATRWNPLARPAWRAVAIVLLAQDVILALLLATPAVHRGKEFDAHYFRFLWSAADAGGAQPLYVLTPDASPYQADDLRVSALAHPLVLGAAYVPGGALGASVPVDARNVLVETRSDTVPSIAGVRGLDLVYEAEPGYRVMARWVGLENSGFIRWLEKVDRWTDSKWKRRVYRVRR